MSFITKVTLLSLLATISFALPNPSIGHEEAVARTVCTSRINANFDDLKPVIPSPVPTLPSTGNINIVPTPYEDLSWNNGFRYFPSANAISAPNRAFYDIVSESLAAPRISTYGSVQYFNLKSAFFACYPETEGAIQTPLDCTFTLVGTKTSGATVSAVFKYTAGPMKQFVLPSTFTNLKSVLFQRSNGVIGNAITYATVDSVVYDVFKTC